MRERLVADEASLAPHCPLGPIALASCLAVDAVCANFAFQETSLGIHYNAEGGSGTVELSEYVANKDVFEVGDDGCVALPMGPGLGIEIDEVKVCKMATDGHVSLLGHRSPPLTYATLALAGARDGRKRAYVG